MRVHFFFFLALSALTCAVAAHSTWQLAAPQRPGLPLAAHDGPAPRVAKYLEQIPQAPPRRTVSGYQRAQFGAGWQPAPPGVARELRQLAGCAQANTRTMMLATQFPAHPDDTTKQGCRFEGRIADPYSHHLVGPHETDIDHIIALAAAWDLGAHAWPAEKRLRFANDPVNLVVVSAAENREKSDSLPSAWLPSDHRARCWYARRVAAVAVNYQLPLPQADRRTLRYLCFAQDLIAPT